MISTVQIVNRLVDAAGAATAYFHRLLNEVIETVNGLSGASGVDTVAPDGSGLAVISHGYAASGRPVSLSRSTVLPTGTAAFLVQIVSVDSDELTIKLFDLTGAAITTGSYDVAWRVGG